jgi:hypothetical protein
MNAIEKKSETNEEYFKRKPWLLKGDGTLREEGEGEWRIAYTPPSGGTDYSRALSWSAPQILNDHEKVAEVRVAAKEVIASQLNNPKHGQFVRRRYKTEFWLVWMEEYALESE